MHNSSPELPHDAYAALRIPGFRNFTLVRFLITIAIQIQTVAVGFTVYKATHDPFALGLIGLTEAIPSIAVALFAGHFADVRSRKTIVLTAMAAMMMSSLALFFYALNFLPHGVIGNEVRLVADTRPIYLVIFLSGIARGFMNPAMTGMAAQLVPRELYPNSSAWSSSTWQTASVLGPAIGGLIFGFLGPRFSFTIDAVLMTAAFFAMLTVPRTPIPPREEETRVLSSIGGGLRFVFSYGIILGALALDLFAVLFGGAVALLPVFTKEVLHAPDWQLGMLRAAPSLGAVLMGLWLAHHPIRRSAGRKLLAAVAAFGMCILAFALSRNAWLSMFILALSGAFDNISVVIRSTLLQLYTPDAMRGRVSAVNGIFIGSSNEIGEFESGAVARAMGAVPSVLFGGTMTILVVVAAYFLAPKLRDLDSMNVKEREA